MLKQTCPNPSCKARFNLADHCAGKKMICSKCKTRFVAGAPLAPAAVAKGAPPVAPAHKGVAVAPAKKLQPAAPVIEQPDEPVVLERRPRRSWGRWLAIALGLVFVVGLAAGGFLFFYEEPHEFYGGIVITSSSVTAVVVEIAPASQYNPFAKLKYDFSLPFRKSHPTNLGKEFKDDSFNADAWEATKDAITTFHKKMSDEFSLKPEQIVILAGSGLFRELEKLKGKEKALARNKKILEEFTMAAVKSPIEYVNAKQELELNLKTLVKEDFRDKMVLVHLGGSASRGGAWNPSSGIPFSFDVGGLKDLQKESGKLAKKDGIDFAAAARSLANPTIGEPLKKKLEQWPVLAKRKRVHLMGGIPWVVATYTNPADRAKPYTLLELTKINEFHEKVLQLKKLPPPPVLPADMDDEFREQLQSEIRQIEEEWDAEKLIAGLEVLREFSAHMNFSKRELYFDNYAYFTTLVGIILTRWEPKG